MIDRPGSGHARRLAGHAVTVALCLTAGPSAFAAQIRPDATAPPAQPAANAPIVLSGVELAVTITSADWIEKPSSDKMNDFLPRSVTTKPGHRAGEVVLKCKLHPDATVSDCTVVDQTNPKVPFGEAAVRASYLFRIRPRAANGTATDANWVLIPVSYDITVIVN